MFGCRYISGFGLSHIHGTDMSKEEMDKKMKQNISALLTVLQDDSADYVQKGNMMRNVVDHIVFDRGNTSLDMFLKLVI